MLNINSPLRIVVRFMLCVALALFLTSSLLPAQTTVSTGSIVGTVTDPQGAVVGGAKVTVTEKATGHVITSSTTGAGTYTSGALTPGVYVVRVEAPGFKTVESSITVEVAVTATGSFKLQLGTAGQVVEVEATELAVNTEQATVQGVLSTEQIDNLPINGRNFLDLAQLEPGVQIQDGGNFDPTKKGFSSISFGGRFGRTARIEVDGVDTSDETVGTTTQDIPLGAIQEFSIGQSTLDLSTELTSSGSVNVVTKSGTNAYHGDAYYNFRDQSVDANLPGAFHTPFQRNQFGGDFGGAFIKNKLFFYGAGERTQQHFQTPVIPGAALSGDIGTYSGPVKEGELLGKVDYNFGKNYKLFYRFSYNQNSDVSSFENIAFQPLNNTNHTRDHVIGLDFTTGQFTHSVRLGYMKFFNHISSGTLASTPFNPTSPIELAIGPDPLCLNTTGVSPDVFCSGQGFLAPQSTPQSDHQVKYDGSRAWGTHIIRYGFGFNHIQGGGFAGFLADGAAVNASASACGVACQALPGGATVALNYPTDFVLLGNGQGFSTEKRSFGFPGGGLGPDNRISWYVGDAWKIRPNFTLNYGLRYVRDTGRSDSDLPGISALAAFDNQFYSGLENRVNNPNKNFAPQLGFAWDPASNGKTVIRGGVGLFYENSIWNNVLFDRPARLNSGAFLATQPACLSATQAVTFTLPNGGATVTPTFCGEPIGQAQAQIAALQAQFQAAAASNLQGLNGSFIGRSMADTGPNGTGTNLFYPGYRTPRSVQMNIGIQRELHRGTVVTADYLRNVSTHTLLAVDTNHVGDTRFFNLADAQAAIAAVETNCGLGNTVASTYSGNCLLNPGAGASDTSYGTPGDPARPAVIGDYAANGLDSGYGLCGGAPCSHAAFGGVNSSLGGNQMLFPIGRSVLNALQVSLKQDMHNPFKGLNYLNLQVSYQLSRYVAMAQDGDFINSAFDAASPNRFIGPDALDRTHQLSFGGTAELPFHFRANLIGHFYSALPATLSLNPTGAGGIFTTGVYGDGTGDGNGPNGSNGTLGAILPGTNLGSYGRGINGSNINNVISNYNTKFAGQPTPAGQVVISNGLMTQADLTSLGGVMPAVTAAPPNEANNTWLKDMDLSFNWTYKIKEYVSIQPGIGFFNILNFANFDSPKNTLSGVLNSQSGSVNGTSGEQPNFLRTGLGSGVFALGAPRTMEFSLKLIF